MMDLIDIFFEATDIRQFVLAHPVSVPPGEECAITGMGFPAAFTSPGYVDGNKAVWQLTVPALERGEDIFETDEDDLSIVTDGNIDLVRVYFYTWAYYEDSAINILEKVRKKKSEIIKALALACFAPVEGSN